MADTDKQLISNLTFALKNVYLPMMIEMIKGENIWIKNLKTKTARLGMHGKTMIFPVRTATVESFAASTEDGVIARPTILSGFDCEIPKKTHTASVQFSHLTDLFTKAEIASYIQTKTDLMEAVAEGFTIKMNEAFIIPEPHALARVNGAPNAVAGTFVVYDEGTAGANGTSGIKYLRQHMRTQASANKTAGNIDLERTYDGQLTADPDPTTLTVTVKGPIGDLTDGDYIYWEGSKGLVTDGLDGIVDDGTIQDTYLTQSRATNVKWRSTVAATLAGGNIENAILRLANSIRTKVGSNQLKKGSGWVIFTTPGVAQAYFEQMKPDRRYQMEAASKGANPVFAGGVNEFWITTPVTGPVQMITDIALPKGKLYLLFFDSKDWYLSQTDDMGWYDPGMGILTRVGRTFILEADWLWNVELVCARPDRQGKIPGITESV